MAACQIRAPQVDVPPWKFFGIGFNWCKFEEVCKTNKVESFNEEIWLPFKREHVECPKGGAGVALGGPKDCAGL
jgi:hypothetical protein